MFTKFKTTYSAIKNKFISSNLLYKIFNRSNLKKVFIIFTIGLMTRMLMVNLFNHEYFHNISIIYYSIFSLCIVIIHEVVNYLNINIIPHFITNFPSHIASIFQYNLNLFKSSFNTIKSSSFLVSIIKWDDLKLSSIIRYIKMISSINEESKMTMGIDKSKISYTQISKPKAIPSIPTTLNMEGDFNLYDSDRNSSGISSIAEASSSRPANNSSLNTTPAKTSSSNNTPLKNNNVNRGLLFTLNPIKDSSEAEMSSPLQTPDPNGYIPNRPNQSALTTPSTMTPLFNSRSSSMDSSYYRDTHGDVPNSNYNGHVYPVPGQVPYFNPTRVSVNSTKAVMGLNTSNENLWRNNFVGSSTDWTMQRYNAQSAVAREYLEITQKEVVPSILSNEIVPREVEVKRGIFGKIKLTFKLIDSKLEAKISNMDSIAIKFHDKGKRKFFWTIWEKKSGNYDSYEEFKSSWDPKTNIWAEIKGKTNNDVRTDVEGILGVGRSRAVIDHTTRRGIHARNVDVRTDVNNLIRERQPFTQNQSESTNTGHNETHRSRNKSHSHYHRKHSSHTHSRRHRTK